MTKGLFELRKIAPAILSHTLGGVRASGVQVRYIATPAIYQPLDFRSFISPPVAVFRTCSVKKWTSEGHRRSGPLGQRPVSARPPVHPPICIGFYAELEKSLATDTSPTL